MNETPVPSEDIPISTVDSPSVVLELIYQLKIKDVMSDAKITANKTHTMRQIQNIMREHHIPGLIVAEEKTIVGIVSLVDLIRALEQGSMDKPVEDYMTRNVILLEEDMPLSFAVNYINKYNYGRFPVLNKKKELVGVITPQDVVRTLLAEMNREVQRLEEIQKKKLAASEMYSEMSFNTVRHDFELAGRASTTIKKALKSRDIDPKIIRRVAIASYELEINQVVHSMGGTITCSIQPDKVIIEAIDTGPGIADVSLVLQEGWSTANEWVRSLGFGAGMGIPNTKRVSDEFHIESTLGIGTTVRSVVFFDSSKEDGQ